MALSKLVKDGDDWRRQLTEIAVTRHIKPQRVELLKLTIEHYTKNGRAERLPDASEARVSTRHGSWCFVKSEDRSKVVDMEHNRSNSSESRRTFVGADFKTYKPKKWKEEFGDEKQPALVYSYYDLFDGSMKKRIATVPGTGVWYIGYANAQTSKKKSKSPEQANVNGTTTEPAVNSGSQSPGGSSAPLVTSIGRESPPPSPDALRNSSRKRRIRFEDEYEEEDTTDSDDDYSSSSSSSSSSPSKRQRTVTSQGDTITFVVDGRQVSASPALMKPLAQAGVLPASLLAYLK